MLISSPVPLQMAALLRFDTCIWQVLVGLPEILIEIVRSFPQSLQANAFK
jgi:hypothetical protein